ncbi:CAMK family protein kinase [Tritrichomonas foetus]|uniref:CAMK family protein kinase n=1 Tax=Tritrichomonas foetus TaxID=1144522 RepID=A0A1J4J8B8_9EUKA|nr:CAMK family protein kinase [Tritrichomonas foetus]|eukprot:OHS95384.1 CAMK family protein kinase [Tritrichomonas foetus]
MIETSLLMAPPSLLSKPNRSSQEPIRYTQSGIDFQIPPRIGNYTFEEIIGSGSYGIVVRGYDHKRQRKVACKVISRQLLSSSLVLMNLEQELRIIPTLKHENVIEVYEILYERDIIIVVMELCENGDLLSFISKEGLLNITHIKRIFYQIVRGIEYIHSKGVAHRDIKLENILLDGDLNAKIADFGCCRTDQNIGPSIPCGTLLYMSSESLEYDFVDDKKCDIWALGVMLYFFVTNKFPFAPLKNNISEVQNSEGLQEEVKQLIKKGEFTQPYPVSAMILDVINSCLKVAPEERPTASEILNMEWFTSENKIRHSMMKLSSQRKEQSFAGIDRTNSRSIIKMIVRPTAKSTSNIHRKVILNSEYQQYI